MAMRGAAKMAMDQILFPPAITAFTFFCLTIIEGKLAGLSLTMDKGFSRGGKTESFSALASKGVDKVKAELGPTLVTNYKVWPLFQILNFQFVPIKLQVLFVNCVAVWWNFVLSMTQHK
jgi:protein Mpv17